MTAWNSWDTIQSAVGDTVLVKFKLYNKESEIHIEDALICDEGDGPYYVLFDGESFNINVEPVAWMRIPD